MIVLYVLSYFNRNKQNSYAALSLASETTSKNRLSRPNLNLIIIHVSYLLSCADLKIW